MTGARRPRDIEDVLARLSNVEAKGQGQWIADCPVPGHRTPSKHLSMSDAGDKALVKCHGRDHPYSAICEVVGFDTLAYGKDDRGGRGSAPIGQGRNTATPTGHEAQESIAGPVAATAPMQPPQGVTLAQLAEAKCLSVTFLQSCGLTDFKYQGSSAVRIPYVNEMGNVAAVRFRLNLTGPRRFAWRRNDRVLPYGLERLKDAAERGWILLVEGESDCWTAWAYGLPCIGIPGKATWQTEWARHVERLEVYLWQEPEAEDFALRVLQSVPALQVIPAPHDVKDISEAHIRGLDVPRLLEECRAAAKPAAAIQARVLDARQVELRENARGVIQANDPLQLVVRAIRAAGYGGDVRPAIITYLSATSRLLEMRYGAMPVHIVVLGASSGGKSYTLGVVKRLLPAEAYHTIDAGSPRVLIYEDVDLRHRVVFFGEADSLPAGEDNPAASAVRNLLQDHYLHYKVTVRDPATGNFTVRTVERPGPTVLVTSSTRPLGDQLGTRLFALEVPDSPGQIAAALATQATLELSAAPPPDDALVAFQRYLQARAPWRVTVPFARELAQALAEGPVAPRVLRDFARLLSLVKAVAVLRHRHRQVDDAGRLVAEFEDYETVRELVAEMYAETVSGAVAAVRELVEAVNALIAASAEGDRITLGKLAARLRIHRSTASRRARKASLQGWLVNREHRKGRPADYALGEAMPPTPGLPSADDLMEHSVQRPTGLAFAPEHEGSCTVAALTGSEIPPSTSIAQRPPEMGGKRDRVEVD